MQLLLKICEESDLKAVVELNIEEYSPDFFTNNRHFKRNFINVKTPDSFLLCAYEGNLLIGTTGMIISRYFYKGKTIKLALISNSLIRKSCRFKLIREEEGLKTIYAKLLERSEEIAKERGCVAAFAFPNQNSFPHLVRNLGYKFIDKLDLLFLPINLAKLVKIRYPKLVLINKIAGSFLSLFYDITHFGIKRNWKYSLYSISNLDDIEKLWQRNPADKNLTLLRDRVYFEWRLAQEDYNCLGIFKGNTIEGYIVWRSRGMIDRRINKTYNCAAIIDFWFNEDFIKSNGLGGAIYEIKEKAKSQGALFIFSFVKLPKHIQKIFEKSGFLFFKKGLLEKKIPLVVKELEDSFRFPEIESCFLTMADNDII